MESYLRVRHLVCAIAEHVKTRDCVSQRRPQKHIRRKMRESGNARKADCSRQTIYNPRHPSMVAVPFRDHGGNRENTRRVAGWKTAAFAEHRNMALEKRIGIIAGCGNRIRPQASANQL